MKDVYEILKDYMIRPKGMFMWKDIPDWEGYQISNHGEVRAVWDRMVSENYSYVVLMGIDKSRHNISRYKLLKGYWKEEERHTGEERWKKLDHYGDYHISNYGNVKNCKALVLWPSENGSVVLRKTVDGKEETVNVSVLKLFLNTFPLNIEINEEDKSVNWKKDDKFITSKQRTGS